ncbi:MAG: prenyltransferase [Sandaracinaceae bacterium]|nr:prenyltransferase [Sandaracinaceae bacterium]
MAEAPAGLWARWWFAVKPGSWPKLLVPCLLGQAIGLGAEGGVRVDALAAGLAFTALTTLFIVLLNDWGDRSVDALKRRMYPRTSGKKTIPDGILPARALLAGGSAAGAAALSLGVLAGGWLDRPLFGVFALGCLLIFVAYTLPPIRANYRGGGELLEMLGVGVALPWTQAYLQGGALALDGLWLLVGFSLLALASAIASGLADERSDRRGGKVTFVSRFGNLAGRRATEGLGFAGAVAWLATAPLPLWLRAAPAVIVLFEVGRMLAVSDAAVTGAFEAQRRYKARLHAGMWRGALAAAMLLAWRHLT